MDYSKMSLELHQEKKGKIEVTSKVPVNTKDDLSVAYTPGVAAPCLAISKDKELVYKYTIKSNTVAVVSDGSAVLGLGNIGAEASIPVMEGKAVLFKEFANVDAFPICLDTQDVDEIVHAVKMIAPVFGGINLEDISAPRCFEVERRLKEELDIPVFHDDQHGTAVVVAAAVINASKLIDMELGDIRTVINGAGSAGLAIGNLLFNLGLKNIVICDIDGAITKDSVEANDFQRKFAELGNPAGETGSLGDVIKGKDLFIGVSAPGVLTKDMVGSMGKKPVVFAMANPTPEIMPIDAKQAGAYIVGTGRSDFDNQINNVLAFPGIFRGALDSRAKDINEEMKIAAARAIAGCVRDEDLSPSRIIPSALEKSVALEVAKSVANAARETGVARI